MQGRQWLHSLVNNDHHIQDHAYIHQCDSLLPAKQIRFDHLNRNYRVQPNPTQHILQQAINIDQLRLYWFH